MDVESVEALIKWQEAIPGPAPAWYALTLAGSGLGYFVLATYLALAQGRPAAGFALAVGWGLVRVLKELFDEPRPFLLAPDLAYPPALAGADDPSFPSGHATLAALFGFFLARGGPVWGYLAAALWALGLGLSRVKLGVHYPGDVLAGWTLGLTLAFLIPKRPPWPGLWPVALGLGLALPLLAVPAGLAAGYTLLRRPLGPVRGALGVLALLVLLPLLPREGPAAAPFAFGALLLTAIVVGWRR